MGEPIIVLNSFVLDPNHLSKGALGASYPINRSMKLFKITFLAGSLLLIHTALFAQEIPDIRLNQIGFYPQATKIAVVLNAQRDDFYIKNPTNNKIVFRGTLDTEIINPHSGKRSRIADFTAFKGAGKYILEVPGVANPVPLHISKNVLKEAARASLKGFYFQRASTELPEKFAGKWARKMGHGDTQVLIHPSATSENRPANAIISSPRGWYDAGDYNKYIVNSGITMGTLLSAYEDFPAFFKHFELNIPESNNKVPDILDEITWNLRWMLTMQDPGDGGVYHKLTNAKFDGIVMPDACVTPRYVVQKNTVATLDFVAVMAQASRIFKAFEHQLPGLSDSCQTAAIKGWKWANENPAIYYNQEKLNSSFNPPVTTGAYGDQSAKDEWFWAAAELYALTKDISYLGNTPLENQSMLSLPSWNQVTALGYYTLLRFADKLQTPEPTVGPIRKMVLNYANQLVAELDKQPYHTVMGKSKRDFVWGSSAVAANQGIALLQAYKLKNEEDYLNAALGNLDYLLGRNATGYSFLTGFGTKQVMHPHHRPSMADGVVAPIPGLLSGGPNPGQQDKCTTYTSNFADESFTDDDCSYASNEIAINWNAPMVYLSTAIEAIMERK